jgi:hypothetical protein
MKKKEKNDEKNFFFKENAKMHYLDVWFVGVYIF